MVITISTDHLLTPLQLTETLVLFLMTSLNFPITQLMVTAKANPILGTTVIAIIMHNNSSCSFNSQLTEFIM